MSGWMVAAFDVGGVICCAFPLLLLLFGILAAQANGRGELRPDVRRIGNGVVICGVLSLALYITGSVLRQYALAWIAAGLIVVSAFLCGWFLRSSSVRPLKGISWALFFNAFFVAAFGAFALHLASDTTRLIAYSNTNEVEVRAALAKNPDDAAAHSSLAMIYSMRGDTARAMAEDQQVLRVEPDNAMALLYLGGELSRAGRIEEARPLYQRLAARHDNLSANAQHWLDRHSAR